VFITLQATYHNGHLQASILGGVVNTNVIRNMRDLVLCAKLAAYYHILVGGVVVNIYIYTASLAHDMRSHILRITVVFTTPPSIEA
jgi:hypothetical protein